MKTKLTKAEKSKVDNVVDSLSEFSNHVNSWQVEEYREKLRQLENIVGVSPEYYSMPGAPSVDGLSKTERNGRALYNQRWVRGLPNSYMLAACGYSWRVRIKMWWKNFTRPVRRWFVKPYTLEKS